MDPVTLVGIGLITIGWLIQFYKVFYKKEKNFDLGFLIVYAVGSFALSYAGFNASNIVTGGLNLVVGLLALVIGYYTK